METHDRIQGKARRDDEEVKMKLDSFLPRTESKIVFVVVMVCYTWTLTAFLNSILRVFHFDITAPPFLAAPQTHPFLCAAEVLVLAPLFESLQLIGIIELARFFRAPSWLQVLSVGVIIGFLHCLWLDDSNSFRWSVRGIAIAPGFAIQAIAYLYWRRVSWRLGFAIVLSIHALHNLIPSIPLIGYGIRHLW
jgi:hypothetical protein